MPRTGSQKKIGLQKVGVIRAAHYERCSSDDHKFQDFSTIENQVEKNGSRIAAEKWQDAGGFSDRGKTGTNLERRGFKKLLEEAQGGKFDVVVVTYMSRLARGPAYHAADYLLKMAGVEVVMVEETFADDFSGQMNKEFTILMDGLQPKQASMHTKTKMAGMAKHGYVCGALPFGFKAELVSDAGDFLTAEREPPKRPVAHADEAPLVRVSYDMAAQGCTLASIREYLKTVAPNSRTWTTTQVKNLLTNEFYVGILQFGDWRNENAHEPMVDRAIWDKVQSLLERPASRPPKNADKYSYLLRGRVRCPHCKCPYTQVSVCRNTRVHYYACLEANKHSSDCPGKRVNADALHFAVLSLVERAARHHTYMHKLIAESGGWGTAGDATRTIRGQLAKKLQFVGVQIENVWKLLDDGRAHDLVIARLDKLQCEQKELTVKLAEVDVDIAKSTVKRPTAEMVCESWGRLLDIWKVMTDEERTTSLQSVVESVEVTAKDRVFLRLSPIAEVHGQMLAINSPRGAGVGLEPTTFGL